MVLGLLAVLLVKLALPLSVVMLALLVLSVLVLLVLLFSLLLSLFVTVTVCYAGAPVISVHMQHTHSAGCRELVCYHPI